MGAYSKKLNNQRQAFLLTFFEHLPDGPATELVNGFYLVKHIDNSISPPRWQVAIYTPQAFKAYQLYLQGRSTSAVDTIPLDITSQATPDVRCKTVGKSRKGKHKKPSKR